MHIMLHVFTIRIGRIMKSVRVVRHIRGSAPARGKAHGIVSHAALTSPKLLLLNLENRAAV